MTAPHGEQPLLAPLKPGPERPLDAVIVPASRSVDHLTTAAAIAAKTGSVLLVLCDGNARAADVGEIAEQEGASRWHAAAVPSGLLPPQLEFPEPSAQLPELGGRVATTRKRNLGLLIARMLGWSTVLFLDDDIRGLDASDVCYATGGLRSGAAVGFEVERWSDRSVVGRVDPMGSASSGVIVGAAALLVDLTSPLLGHFPAIHNADRLFLYDAFLHGMVQQAPGRVHRFADAAVVNLQRAGTEEFGEVIGRGLVRYARHRGRALVPLHEGYWREVLADRREFIDEVAGRLAVPTPNPRIVTARSIVRVAEQRHAAITPASCVRFYQHWRRERRIWQERLARVRPAGGVSEALRRLGMEPARPTPERLSRIAGAPGTAPITMMKYVSPGADVLALVVPGFLDNGCGPVAATMAKAIQAQGHTAVTFDPRGTWRSRGDLGSVCPDAQAADVLRVLDSRRRYGRVVLVGHSLGALVACLAAVRDERITDVVAIMPPRCFVWPFDYDESRDRWGSKRRIAVSHGRVSWAFRVPHSVVTRAAGHDLPAALAQMDERVRILFIAGADDQVIPADAVRRLHSECRTPKKEIRVLPIGHDYRDRPDHRKLVNDTVLKWLAEGSSVAQPTCPVLTGRIGRDDRNAMARSRLEVAKKYPELLVGTA